MYHDELQSLGPIATIFAALMAVIVTGMLGCAQWRVARAQKDIAFDKLKLDLFERRYRLYKNVERISFDIMRAELSGTVTFTQEDVRSLDEGVFLFSKPAADTIKKIASAAGSYIVYTENAAGIPADNPKRAEQRKLAENEWVILASEKIVFDAALKKEMSFEHLRKSGTRCR
jgi:hypothetical protein